MRQLVKPCLGRLRPVHKTGHAGLIRGHASPSTDPVWAPYLKAPTAEVSAISTLNYPISIINYLHELLSEE